jgi:pimeloyl-ACP methyl ester carboxylesterase/DNA-binding CsgD family transcriptional regulator
MRPPVRFCTSSDGARLAFAVSGEGPPLVRAPHWFTHLEHDWTNPAMRPWVEDLSKRYRLLRFDQRGNGLSDRKVPEISLEAHVRDLEAVVDAAGFERFALLGLSQGAAIGVVYAVRHPERVSHLVLCGGFVRGWAGLPGEMVKRYDMDVDLIRFGWDRADPSYRQVFTSQFMPDAPVEAIQGFNDHMPIASSAETAATLYENLRNVDVRDAARQVRCPTLVLHGRGDMRVPIEEGRVAAGLIPGARFVTLETRNHLMMQDEPAWRVFLDTLAEFYPPAPAALAADIFPRLTAREREVLELIAQGLDNAQIAARLEISEKTVRNNITHIFDKISVENRSQAIVLARESGLGKAPRP